MRLNPHVLAAQVEDFGPVRRAQSDPAVISLAVADPYKRPFAHVLQAYHQAIDDGFTRYGPSEGFLDLREAIARKLASRNGISADPEGEILVTHGAGNAFLHALMACLQPGDEVLTPDPSFPLNFGSTQVLGAIPVSCPLDGPGGLAGLPDRMAEAVTPRTRMIILHNPNNPTGDVLPRDVLERIARLAQAHDLAVLSDEVYERYVYDGHEHVSMATLPGMQDRTITVFSFSKDYGLSGLRVGYLTAARSLVAAISRIQRNDGSGANAPGQRAALAALTGPQDGLDSWRCRVRRRSAPHRRGAQRDTGRHVCPAGRRLFRVPPPHERRRLRRVLPASPQGGEGGARTGDVVWSSGSGARPALLRGDAAGPARRGPDADRGVPRPASRGPLKCLPR